MEKEELIKSLRSCSAGICFGCTLFTHGDLACCCDHLMQAAADMLEQDAGSTQEKTADEMFRELGYEKVDVSTACYANNLGEYIEIDHTVDGKTTVAKYERISGYGVRHVPFESAEIRADCKLLDEMGAE